jgi:hypothetical protein
MEMDGMVKKTWIHSVFALKCELYTYVMEQHPKASTAACQTSGSQATDIHADSMESNSYCTVRLLYHTVICSTVYSKKGYYRTAVAHFPLGVSGNK